MKKLIYLAFFILTLFLSGPLQKTYAQVNKIDFLTTGTLGRGN